MAANSYNLRPEVVDAYDLAELYLKRTGLPNTRSNRVMLTAWFMAESARIGSRNIRVYNNNPLNITTSSSDYHKFAGIGLHFANYSDATAGADAWYGLLQRRYPRILSAFREDKGYLELAAAISASPWGTSGNLVKNIASGLGGTVTDWVQSVFGGRFSLSRGYSSSHDGIDLKAAAGTPIRAVRGGRVTYARNAASQADQGLSAWARGGGNVVNIDAGDGYITQYANMQRFTVKEGENVRAGQIIGYVGSTGNSTGPHLHFGLLDKTRNRMVDPRSYLTGKTGAPAGDNPSQYVGGFFQNGAPLVEYKRGHVLTDADVEHIVQVLDSSGFIPTNFDPVSRALAIEQIRKVLKSHVGDKWNEELLATISKELGIAAVASGGNVLGSVFSLPPELATWLDPAAWTGRLVRGFAVVMGAGLVLFGIKIILGDVGSGGGTVTVENYIEEDDEDSDDDFDEDEALEESGGPLTVPAFVKKDYGEGSPRARRGTSTRYTRQREREEAAERLKMYPPDESPPVLSATFAPQRKVQGDT